MEVELETLPDPQLWGGLKSEDTQRLEDVGAPQVPGIKGSIHALLSSSSC